ncbi:hypothetical protein BC828DRAFT_371605 [Blastocladiella britannica]|nr:hypothetical protein BC828DRAFT_371605 [Blastocladiella britannica]
MDSLASARRTTTTHPNNNNHSSMSDTDSDAMSEFEFLDNLSRSDSPTPLAGAADPHDGHRAIQAPAPMLQSTELCRPSTTPEKVTMSVSSSTLVDEDQLAAAAASMTHSLTLTSSSLSMSSSTSSPSLASSSSSTEPRSLSSSYQFHHALKLPPKTTSGMECGDDPIHLSQLDISITSEEEDPQDTTIPDTTLSSSYGSASLHRGLLGSFNSAAAADNKDMVHFTAPEVTMLTMGSPISNLVLLDVDSTSAKPVTAAAAAGTVAVISKDEDQSDVIKGAEGTSWVPPTPVETDSVEETRARSPAFYASMARFTASAETDKIFGGGRSAARIRSGTVVKVETDKGDHDASFEKKQQQRACAGGDAKSGDLTVSGDMSVSTSTTTTCKTIKKLRAAQSSTMGAAPQLPTLPRVGRATVRRVTPVPAWFPATAAAAAAVPPTVATQASGNVFTRALATVSTQAEAIETQLQAWMIAALQYLMDLPLTGSVAMRTAAIAAVSVMMLPMLYEMGVVGLDGPLGGLVVCSAALKGSPRIDVRVQRLARADEPVQPGSVVVEVWTNVQASVAWAPVVAAPADPAGSAVVVVPAAPAPAAPVDDDGKTAGDRAHLERDIVYSLLDVAKLLADNAKTHKQMLDLEFPLARRRRDDYPDIVSSLATLHTDLRVVDELRKKMEERLAVTTTVTVTETATVVAAAATTVPPVPAAAKPTASTVPVSRGCVSCARGSGNGLPASGIVEKSLAARTRDAVVPPLMQEVVQDAASLVPPPCNGCGKCAGYRASLAAAAAAAVAESDDTNDRTAPMAESVAENDDQAVTRPAPEFDEQAECSTDHATTKEETPVDKVCATAEEFGRLVVAGTDKVVRAAQVHAQRIGDSAAVAGKQIQKSAWSAADWVSGKMAAAYRYVAPVGQPPL